MCTSTASTAATAPALNSLWRRSICWKRSGATGKPLIVVLTTGSALAVPWVNEHADALLAAWYPGEEGGDAIAETLAGKNNPAGRLPVTFYRSTSDLPAFTDYSMSNRTYRYFKGEVMYPFGFGLELFALQL